ncbi:PREDICTED: LOC109707349 isoform [Prunus dulcis]|uniref:PREDICTED: LOC109707349 isoform n=2 Tax=Prunus dulcis TaxID=3755 RepID=A0A5E4E6D3_PRUDU|nr:PREDICTED: LOC109707349 isoform [Prunus dulcis]
MGATRYNNEKIGINRRPKLKNRVTFTQILFPCFSWTVKTQRTLPPVTTTGSASLSSLVTVVNQNIRMTGFGSYGNGGPYPYSSSPSSLSALAPPFTVDRSVPKPMSSPLVDVTETPYVAPLNSSSHNWLPSHPPITGSNFFANPTPEFNSLPSSNAYRYAGSQTVDPPNTTLPALNTITPASSNAFTYGQSLDAVATSFVEAKPYYPSYLSPTIHGDSPLVVPDQPSYDWLSTTHFAPLDGCSRKDYTQRPPDLKYTAQWGGLWNGLSEWEQGKQGDFDGSFCSKKTDVSGSFLYKNFMNQEPHSSNSLNSFEEASHGINTLGWEKPGGSGNAHLGDKSFVGKNSKFTSSDFSKSIMGSLSVVPEPHLKAPSSQCVTKTSNCKTPYSVSSETQQLDASLDYITSISESSPAFATRTPALGTKLSEPETGLFRRLNFISDAADTDHGDYYSSGVQESHPPQISEGKVLFDSSQLGFHLGTKDCFSAESSSARNEELSNNRNIINKDAWDKVFKAKPVLQNSHVGLDGFKMAFKTNETINSFLSSSDNVDPNNPGVDSPCWKGVPGSRFSPFGASEDGVPEQIKKLEDCSGLNIHMPMFPLNAGENVSSQKPIKNAVEYNEFGWLENGLRPPLKRYSVANSAFGEHKWDNPVKTTYDAETSHDRGPQSYRDGLHQSGNGDKSLGLLDDCHTMQQGHGEDGLATEVKQTWSCVADVKLNANDTMEYGSSHVPSRVVENVLCSSAEDAATKLSKSNWEESMLKVDVQMLVDTLKNLSELLLTNCSNGLCQLKKTDIATLKAVINNLHICISKNVEKWSPMQESPTFQQNTSQCYAELSEHHKVLSADRPLSASAPNIQDQVIGSIHAKSDIDMVKEDKMTQAIKEILSENFHSEETDPQVLLYKNLWLEAEAVLCSVNYKARFNRVKIEIDKCKAENSKDVFEYTADMMKQSKSEVSPDSNPVNPLTPEAQGCPTSNVQDLPILSQEDEVLARFDILRGRVENTNSINASNAGESSSKASPEPSKFERIAPEANSTPSPVISIQDSSISSTIGVTDDYEASVMARFHILRDRVEKSKFISAVNMEEPSSPQVEPKTDVIVPDRNDGSVSEFNLFQDSPLSITTSQANDCEASVMSRLHILKSRVDNCSDMHTEGHQLPEPKIEVIAPDTSDSLMPEFSIQDSPVSRATSQANDCEASVMSRLHILKSRVDNSSYMHREGKQLPEIGGLGNSGKRHPWPIISKRSEGGSSDIKEQPILRSFKADNSEGKLDTAKEFHLFVEDDPLTQYFRIHKPANQLPAGGHDNSSSDWEHVMKEEIWGQNC